MKLKLKNIFGEKLDLLIEGKKSSPDLIIFVHGYGTDKNEGFAYFLDLSQYLKKDFFLIRFDLSGYGQSEGQDYQFQFQKAAGDLDSVIRYARKNYPDKNIHIIAHSLGTFITALLSPHGIKKIVFTSPVNSNTEFVSRQLEKRITAKGGTVNKNGLTLYKRSSGAIQKIGPDFWRTLAFDPIEYFKDLAGKTDLIIFKPLQDDVLENKYFDDYKTIANLKYIELNGDHNFKKPQDRQALFQKIKHFLLDNKTITA